MFIKVGVREPSFGWAGTIIAVMMLAVLIGLNFYYSEEETTGPDVHESEELSVEDNTILVLWYAESMLEFRDGYQAADPAWRWLTGYMKDWQLEDEILSAFSKEGYGLTRQDALRWMITLVDMGRRAEAKEIHLGVMRGQAVEEEVLTVSSWIMEVPSGESMENTAPSQEREIPQAVLNFINKKGQGERAQSGPDWWQRKVAEWVENAGGESGVQVHESHQDLARVEGEREKKLYNQAIFNSLLAIGSSVFFLLMGLFFWGKNVERSGWFYAKYLGEWSMWAVWNGLLRITVLMMGGGILVYTLTYALPDYQSGLFTMVGGTLLILLCLMVLVRWYFPHRTVFYHEAGMTFAHLFQRKLFCWVGIGILLDYLLLGYLMVWLQPLLGGGSVEDIISPELLRGERMDFISEMWQCCILAPVFEEVLFRGILFSALRRRVPVLFAVVLSSLVFAGLHFYSLSGFVSVFLGGCIFAWVYHKTESLWAPILIHAITNALIVIGIWGLFAM